MKKNLIRLTESEIRTMITEVIKEVICESIEDKVEEYRSLLYTVRDIYDMKEKKAIAAEYGISSPKTAVMQDFFANKLRELRQTRTSFDENDFRDFLHLNVNLKTIGPLVEQEPIGMKDIILKGILKYCNNTLGGRTWYKIYHKAEDTYNNSKAFMPDEQKAELQQKDNSIEQLTEKLVSLLEEYKGEYIKRVETTSVTHYNNIPNEIQRLEDVIKRKYDEYDQKKRNKEFKGLYASSMFLDEINKLERKSNAYKNLITRKYPTVDTFVQACVDEANKEFKIKIRDLANRVVNKGFDIPNIQVTGVQDDPKIFSLRITDGKQRLFCRSILAAEFSDKMVPHFRFIMTNG